MKRPLIYILALAALLFTACQKDANKGGSFKNDGVIKYSIALDRETLAEAADADDTPSTRGTLVNTTGDDDKALAEFTGIVTEFIAKAYTDEGVEKVSQTVEWKSSAWDAKPVTYWPQATKLNFLAYANLPAGQTAAIAKEGVTTEHSVPAAAKDQTDVLFGYYRGNGNNIGTAQIRFEHPLTSVRFLRGSMSEALVIKSISLAGVAETGTATMDPYGKITWADVDSYEYTVDLSSETGLDVDEDTHLIGEPFILIPQNLDENNVTVSVSFTNGTTVTGTLASVEWKSGHTYTYSISASGELDIKLCETIDGFKKSEVQVENTGALPVYVRMCIVASWVDGYERFIRNCDWMTTGTLVGKAWGGVDDKWVLGSDGWFYYKNALAAGPGVFTDCLFDEYEPSNPTIPGTKLMMDVMTQAVEFDESKDKVRAAWGDAAAALLTTDIDD